MSTPPPRGQGTRARAAGRAKGPVVHFNGHFDVVPAGEGWTVDPFGGEVRDGKIWGRGTGDMKAERNYGGPGAGAVVIRQLCTKKRAARAVPASCARPR